MSIKKNVGLSLLLASLPSASFAEDTTNPSASFEKQQTEDLPKVCVWVLSDIFSMLLRRIDLTKVETDAELDGTCSTAK